MSSSAFLSAPLGPLFLRTALPIIVVMMLSGLQNVIDAIFLGQVVGAVAVAAVSAIFPVTMIAIALSSLVNSGMSSRLARRLGAGEIDAARAVFASAHGLALVVSCLLISGMLIGGEALTRATSGGDADVAVMSITYLAITLGAAPVMFLLGLHVDALRCEGRAPVMALLSVLVTLFNIALNGLFIVYLDMGVAGSAWGTVLAQALGFALLLGLRARIDTPLPLTALKAGRWWGGWGRMLALGAPLSLSFIGLALVSSITITMLQVTDSPTYKSTLAAYGIATRLVGFAFLPLMGLAQGLQAIVGNLVGARMYDRSDRALMIALGVGLAYCGALELVFQLASPALGRMFVDDALVVSELGRILRHTSALYVVTGPVLLLGLYFQSVGDAGRAGLLTLPKTLVVQPVLIVALGFALGEPGIWIAAPIGDAVLATLAVVVLLRARRPGRAGLGVREEPA